MATVNLDLAPVHTCSATGCAFNEDVHCHAPAITVGDHGQNHCGTFLGMPTKARAGKPGGHVGACQLADCVHNADLSCTADSIEVASESDGSRCLTYSAA